MRFFFTILAAFPVLAGPVLHFTETAYNFGNLIQGDVVSHEFTFENRGDAELQISKVSASCGCTAGEVSRKNLKPSEKGSLKVTFNSEKFTGNQRKTVIVYANDSRKPYEEIAVSASVKKVCSVEPSYVTFDTAREAVVRILNLHQSPIQYLHVKTEKPETLPDIVFDRKFPLLSAGVRPDSAFVFRIRMEGKSPPAESRYGNLDLKLGYEDGRSFTKRIGVAVKKWR